MFSTYGLKYDYFHAPTMFSWLQADFGFLSPVIFVVFFLIAIIVAAVALSKARHRPSLFLLLSGQSIYFFTSIEINYDGYFYYFRALVVFTVLYWVAILSCTFLKYLFRSVWVRN